jgi:hypothetical protein
MSKFSTWMAWIWSSKCLALICTSTHSSTFKWESRRGINRPTHQYSPCSNGYLRYTVGWTDGVILCSVGSSCAVVCPSVFCPYLFASDSVFDELILVGKLMKFYTIFWKNPEYLTNFWASDYWSCTDGTRGSSCHTRCCPSVFWP